MANNEYVNKVLFGDTIVMDISDTTAEEGDVIEGQIFYTRSGAPATGSLGDATTSAHGLMSVSDKIKLDNIDEIQAYKTIDAPADVISFNEGVDDLPMTLTVAVEPVQDLHGYDNPWPAGGGKNLYNKEATDTNNGYVYNKYLGSDGSLVSPSQPWIVSEYFSVKAGTTYTVSGVMSSSSVHCCEYDAEKNFIASHSYATVPVTFTTDSDTTYVRISRKPDTTSQPNPYAMFEEGSSASAWEPYSNICPISGWAGANVTRTGKNLFTNNTFQQGGIDTNGNNSDAVGTYNQRVRTVGFIPLRTGTYTVSSAGEKRIYLRIYDTYGNFLYALSNELMPMTFTLSNDSKIRFALANSDTSTNITPSDVSNIQIESGSTATSYEPFGTTYSIAFPSSAGTVYGGTLTINMDGTGELVVENGYLEMGGANWYYNASNGYFTITISDMKNTYWYASDITDIFSPMFRYKGSTVGWGNMKTGTFGVNTNEMRVKLDGYTTASAFKEAVSGQIFVYPLATPVTYKLTAPQVRSILGLNNIWADTGKINEVEYAHEAAGLINTKDKIKLDSLSTVAISGDYDDLSNKPDLSGYITSVPTMTGATANANGTAGLIPAPTTADAEKFFRGDGTWQDGGKPMVILSYGNSTWDDFITAYNNRVIVYCRASSNSNPKTGSQTRMAFMAYVNDATTPTNVEFQYYRSMSSHSSTAMSDQVFVYKLDKTSGWSVITRDASIKQITGSGITVSWNSNVVTLTNDVTVSDSLTDTSTTKALSAAKGKALNDSLSGKLDTNQGSTNSGKFMKVDSDGTLTPDNVPNPSTMTGASSGAAGTSGLVPTPSAGDQDKVLKGDGTWGTAGLDSSDIANNLNATETGKVLDARQGKVLNDNKLDKHCEPAFTPASFKAPNEFQKENIWSDGEDVYYSSGSSQYILDKFTSTWIPKTWSGLTSFNGNGIWTDGENIYYSSSTNQYILDKSTSTWSKKKWTGMINYNGKYIWSDGENIYYSNSSNQYVLNKSTSTWNQKTWTGLTSFRGDYIWSDGANIYYSNYTSQYILDKSTSAWNQKTWTGLTTFNGIYIWTDGENIYCSNDTIQYVLDKSTSTWSQKTWNGLTNFYGSDIWSDGENIYYSNSSNQYILDKSTFTWIPKTWSGMTDFNGIRTWTDGENIYYSSSTIQYILDKSTFIWSKKTWNGLTDFYRAYIWTDGENIYYSNSLSQYVLDKSTSTWTPKTWTGLTDFNGGYVWTDGENIYYSNNTSQYVLDKSTSTWNQKTWSGLTSFLKNQVWTDGENIYYSNSSDQYVLDKSTFTWSQKTWTGLTNFDGKYIWTDGDNIYYSNYSTQYVLDRTTSTWTEKIWNGLTNFNGQYIWSDGENTYYSNYSSQYVLDTQSILLGSNGQFTPIALQTFIEIIMDRLPDAQGVGF